MKSIFATAALLFIKLSFVPNLKLLAWVFVAIGVDFITGVIKAKVKKVARTSTGMRRTIVKLLQYVGVIAGVVILGNILDKDNPMMAYVNDGVLVFIIYIEVKSVFENLYEMDQESPISKFFIKPVLALLSLGIQKMPISQAGNALNQEKEINSNASNNGTIKMVLIIASCLSLASCKIPQRSTSSTVTDSTIITQRPVDTTIKGSNVQAAVNIDSLLDVFRNAVSESGNDNEKLMQALKALNRPVIINDTSGKVQLSYWMDAAGKLQVSCASKDQTIQFLITEVNRIRSEKKTETVYVKEAKWYTWLFLGFAIVFGILFALAIAFRKRF